MSYYCTNPGCYQGDPSGAPEYAPGKRVTCTVCVEDFDLDDDPMYYVKGKRVCEGCTESCEYCGEKIDDDTDHSDCASDEESED